MCDEAARIMLIVKVVKLVERSLNKQLDRDEYNVIVRSSYHNSPFEIDGVLFDLWGKEFI